MTLILSNDEVDGLLQMPDCMAAMEGAFRAIGDRRAANAGRCEILTPTAREDALYSLMNMNGVVPELGVRGRITCWSGVGMCMFRRCSAIGCKRARLDASRISASR